MLSIKTRLLSAEDELLYALDQGKDAVAAFSLRWESLLEEIDRAMDASELDVETSGLAHTVALRCATLAEISADLVADCNTIHSHLMGELDSLMSELMIHDSRTFPTNIPIDHSAPTQVMRSLSSQTKSTTTETSRKRRRSEEPPALFSPRRLRANTSNSTGLLALVDDSPAKQTPPPHCHPSPNQLIRHLSHPASHLVGKRRHSDTDLGTPPLQHKRLCAGPRLHAVSDSFAISRGTGSCSTPLSPSLLSSIPIRRELIGQTPGEPTSLDVQPLLEPLETSSCFHSDSEVYEATLADSVLFDLSAPSIPQAASPSSTFDVFFDSLFKENDFFHLSPTGILQSPTSFSASVPDYSSSSTECDSDSRSSSPSPSTPSYPSTPPPVGLSGLESSIYAAWSNHDHMHALADPHPLLHPGSQSIIHDITPCTPPDDSGENFERHWNFLLGSLDPLLPFTISSPLVDSRPPSTYTPLLSQISIGNNPGETQLTSLFKSSGPTLVDAC